MSHGLMFNCTEARISFIQRISRRQLSYGSIAQKQDSKVCNSLWPFANDSLSIQTSSILQCCINTNRTENVDYHKLLRWYVDTIAFELLCRMQPHPTHSIALQRTSTSWGHLDICLHYPTFTPLSFQAVPERTSWSPSYISKCLAATSACQILTLAPDTGPWSL